VSGFVDIHSHILYGLDDGARTLEDSVAMLELAALSGTTDIVATPHANGRYSFNPALVDERIAELSARTAVRIHRGCDFHLQFDNIEDAVAHPDKYTINHHSYLLVEFPDLSVFGNTEAVLLRLLDAGLVPIISHPERHPQLPRMLDDLARWIEIGCYVQVTAASYTGLFGKPAKACAQELLERGLTHFVASDAHDAKRRTPDLNEAYSLLSDRWGEDRIRPLFVENPAAAVEGDTIDTADSTGGPGGRKWYQFWK
jgi:protein-tyrosine phosphatase